MLFNFPRRIILAVAVAAPSVAILPTFGSAQNGQQNTHTESAQTARRLPPPPPVDLYRFGVIRQDLFDRNNPNNRRHDYPPPPAQPGQY